MLTRIFSAVAVILIALAISSCGQSGNNQNKGDEKNALHISIGASPQSIDPHVVTGVPGIKVLAAIGETLVSLNPETLDIIPAAATEWNISPDGLRYTFKLRPEARWSNGEAVTAHDFVYAWQRAMTPSVGWQYATDYYFLNGAESYHLGKSKDKTSLGIYARDNLTLEFNLNRPYPLFLKQLTSEQKIPVHQKSLESFGQFDDTTTNWTKAGNYLSNGPFVLDTWEINKIIVLKKNPYYWNKENVKLDTIYAYPLETESAEERAFRSGQIQLAFGGRIPVDKIATYKEKSPENLRIINGYATYFYLFNTTQAPFDDVRVRKALAHAIDRVSIVKNITKAGEASAITLNPPTPAYIEYVTPLEYNLEYAKKLLSDAGYPDGKNFPDTTLIYNTSDIHRKVALAIQQMWKQHLGVNITLQNQEWKVFLNTRQNLDFSIARAGSISSIGDPQDFLEGYRTGHGMNDTGWSNTEYDALIEQASQTIEQTQRYTLLGKAESILLEEMPLIPLYYYSDSYLIKNEVKGVVFNPLKRINFADIYIEKSEQN